MNAPVKIAPTTCATLREVLPTMAKGEAIIYHTGLLMYDRERGATFMQVDGVAVAAYEAYEKKVVLLVQRKLGPNKYEYIAIKR